jgi:hypothetical protein
LRTRPSFAADAVLLAANGLLAVPVTYLGILTTGGMLNSLMASKVIEGTKVCEPSRHFVILVPAHDEEAVIGRLLTSLSELRYPPQLFDVWVVADNCRDETAAIARSFGAGVLERTDTDHPGKGFALNWAIREFSKRNAEYDVAVFIDADSVVEPAFLMALDARFDTGSEVVQGYYGVLDPETSPAVALRSAALACRHHLRPLGRSTIGGSCGLFGNGMAMLRSVAESREWTSHLVEDLEFQLELLLNGTLVTYEPKARLHAEMPDTLERSTTQHQRWERGRMQVLRRFLPLLVQSSVRDREHRVAKIDAALDIVVPPLSLLAGAVGTAAICSVAVNLVGPTGLRRVSAQMGLLMSAVMSAHVLLALRMTRAPRSVYVALSRAPQLLIWKIRVMAKLTHQTSRVEWVRTQRNTSTA